MARPVAQRLFFALWPEPETAQQIWQAAAGLVPAGTGRRLPAQYLHVTLAYLGSQDAGQQQCAIDAADRVQGNAFKLLLDQAGHFPRPQVVWLGARQTPTALASLQTKLVSQLKQQCGYVPEVRAFLPHITLWRKVKRVDPLSWPAPFPWLVSSFVLARSETLPSGVRYSVIQRWSLAQAQE